MAITGQSIFYAAALEYKKKYLIAVLMILLLYKYGVAFNTTPIATRASDNSLGLCPNAAEPAIARIRPMKAASGAR